MRKGIIFYILIITALLLSFILISCSILKDVTTTTGQIETDVIQVVEEKTVDVKQEIPEYSYVSKSGRITSDEKWSGEIYITGDIVFTEEATLTILPGTKVIFAAHSDDQKGGSEVPLDEWIASQNDPTGSVEYAQSHCSLAAAKLIAEGTADEVITFTSDSKKPDGADWMQVHFGMGSIIEYCILEYSRGGFDVAPDSGDDVTISNSIMRHNLWTGLTVHENSNPLVSGNTIYESGAHQGIASFGNAILEGNEIKDCKVGIVVLYNSSPVIKNNTLIDNDCGISINDNSTPEIEANLISSPQGAQYNWTYKGEDIYFASSNENKYGEVTGIVIINSSPTITGNTIENCANIIGVMGNSSPLISRNIIRGGRNNGLFFQESFDGSPYIYENNFDNSNNIGMSSSCSIEAMNNWWGTINPDEIESRIWHGYDDSTLGTVIYEPFLSQPLEID